MRNTSGFHKIAARVAAVVGAVAMMAVTVGCGTSSARSAADGTVNVVVSINQWKSVASDIGGSKATVTSILANQNVEAHDFEPQPSDIVKISKAQIVLVNGAGYDSWATKATQNAPDAVVVNAATTAGIASGANPHVWFSAAARKAAAKAYLTQLQKAAPDDSSYFAGRYEAWLKKENALEKTIAEAKSKTQGISYAATESVAHYLAEDLGLKDATPSGYVQATENDSEPAPGDIRTFQKKLESGSIKMLIVNDQEMNSTSSLIVSTAKKSKVPIVHLTESMPSKEKDLTTWVTSLVKSVDAAVK
ncbi:MAG: zinc ABC transporter substrate-binding protein [Bifidobacteriaceae bacterium]|jgi:zinc/manganese transport system substrate-binding protein|nr:zinc ABC transporter substrate-binding protein [Bifidobacteriaceae bacterium]